MAVWSRASKERGENVIPATVFMVGRLVSCENEEQEIREGQVQVELKLQWMMKTMTWNEGKRLRNRRQRESARKYKHIEDLQPPNGINCKREDISAGPGILGPTNKHILQCLSFHLSISRAGSTRTSTYSNLL